ncbi:ABC transporter substrate-binding protein [Paenibacillus sp. OVF10]|nr:ABC transporter substrate-binding protein [Paenibacillus sp. OVF10]
MPGFTQRRKKVFADEGIDAEIIPGGPDIVIEQQVVNGAADVGITGVDSLLVSRDNGLPLVSLAQISQKSSYRLIAKKSLGITDPAQMKGKRSVPGSAVSSFRCSRSWRRMAWIQRKTLNW